MWIFWFLFILWFHLPLHLHWTAWTLNWTHSTILNSLQWLPTGWLFLCASFLMKECQELSFSLALKFHFPQSLKAIIQSGGDIHPTEGRCLWAALHSEPPWKVSLDGMSLYCFRQWEKRRLNTPSPSQTHSKGTVTAAGLSGDDCGCVWLSLSDKTSCSPGCLSFYYIAEMTLNFGSSCSIAQVLGWKGTTLPNGTSAHST